MIGIDTNLLVYAHRAGAAEHRAARAAIERARDGLHGWGIPLPCIAEFLSVVTHPACSGGPSDARQAHAFLSGLIVQGQAAVWPPGGNFWERFARAAADLGLRGARVFDLQIALTAFDNGATELWTHDRNFVSIPGLRVRDPLMAP